MTRRILHIDMDAFFASVEQLRDPALRGKPVIVGGAPEDRRGVVSTASYEARVFGVHSAMPLAEAKRLCPHGVFLRGNFADYRAASEKVRAVLDQVSPLVEPASIDEAYIDVTGSQRLFGGDDAIAAFIKTEIRATTGLPCTIAIAPNKLVAKVASDEGKPDGYLRIANGEEAAFFAPLPIKKLPGVGPRTRELLERLGIMTIGRLASMPSDALQNVFGQHGYTLQRAAQGISTSEVVIGGLPKSISRETTFPEDRSDWPGIEAVLAYLTERAVHSLREKGMEARCVTLKVRYGDFQTRTFAQTLPAPTSLDRDVLNTLRTLLPKAMERRARVRLVGVALGQLHHNTHQLALWDHEHGEKWGQVLSSVDALRAKHGFETLRLGGSLSLGKDIHLATPSLSR